MNASPDFLKFIGCLGLPITSQNLAFFTDLYVNFTQFYVEPQDSFEMKLIKWKRFYDASSFPLQMSTTHDILETTPSTDFDYADAVNTQANIQQPLLSDVSPPPQHQPCKISSTPPLSPTTTPPSPQLISTNAQLPHELVPIQNTQNCYQNFILKNDVEKQAPPDNMVEHIEIMASSLNENTEVIASQGKNIAQMKQIYDDNKTKIPKPKPRKRKRVDVNNTETENETENETGTTLLGPGRPTKDDALLREANENDDDETFGQSQMAMREVQLLSSNGTIRKKIKILTKYPKDIKCFAIKHYASYEYVAKARKEALEKIKEQRSILKSLQYIETNIEPYIKDMASF
jgi:hypothetical protein